MINLFHSIPRHFRRLRRGPGDSPCTTLPSEAASACVIRRQPACLDQRCPLIVYVPAEGLVEAQVRLLGRLDQLGPLSVLFLADRLLLARRLLVLALSTQDGGGWIKV